MQKKHIKQVINILAHPLMLSLFITILIIVLFPVRSAKYKLELKNSQRLFREVKILWDDLENDGISDQISTDNSPIGTAGLTLRLYPSGYTEQWDLKGQFKFENDNFFITGDYDGNGKKEIYAFTLSNDTIYLSCISDFYHLKNASINRFIAKIGLIKGKSDVSIGSLQMADITKDGYMDLIFSINAGFSIYPRAVFIYDIKNDNLQKSPELGFYPTELLLYDINGDGTVEIIPAGGSPKNITDRIVEFTDSSCWVMVLDKNLHFIFPPHELPGRTGSIFPVAFPASSNKLSLTVLWQLPPNDSIHYMLYGLNSNGTIISKKRLTEIEAETLLCIPFVLNERTKEVLMLPTTQGKIFCYNNLFNLVEKMDIGQKISDILYLDIDDDHRQDVIAMSHELNRITIYRSGFIDPASIDDIKLEESRKTRFSVKKTNNSDPMLFISNSNMYYTIGYGKNPAYYAKYIIYISIYLSILLFTLLVRKLQRIQLQRRYTTEKKITELQLKIVRNQMDPHFTMNAINAVVDAINREEKEEARENLLHFSKMYRSLVLSADKIKRSLREEIDFTENYLALEQFRFGKRFTYRIAIDPGVDLAWEVPKMVIQAPVENAVKHGLLKKEAGGEIVIHARHEERKLILQIDDNGIGRAASAMAGQTSTGKGMEMMEQFFELYHKITGIKVHSIVSDLMDENGVSMGTTVMVTIPLL